MEDPVPFVALVLAVAALISIPIILAGRRPVGTAVPASLEARMSEFEARLADNDHRVKNVQQAMQALATTREVHNLEVKITEVGGEVKALKETVTGTNRMVSLIHSHILDHAVPKHESDA